jgi:hypothetical protein
VRGRITIFAFPVYFPALAAQWGSEGKPTARNRGREEQENEDEKEKEEASELLDRGGSLRLTLRRFELE